MPVDINKIVKKPMNDFDIHHYLPDTKIYKYSDLESVESIENLLPKSKDAFVLLIESTPDSGHWVGVLRYNNTIEYFDSYGKPPSEPLEWLSPNQNKKLNQDYPYLNHLFNMTPLKVVYNDKNYQKHSQKVNTCGAHVVFRILQLLENNLNLSKYNKLMKRAKQESKLSYDQIVSAFINLRDT
jgi:hypothetical protein